MEKLLFNTLVKAITVKYINIYRRCLDDPSRSLVEPYKIAHSEFRERFVSDRSQATVADMDTKEWFLRTLILSAAADKHSWDAVKMIALMHLNAHEPLPNVLADWLVGVLTCTILRPRCGSQIKWRDTEITYAIRELVEKWGLKATRSNASAYPRCCLEGGSACDIVGKAFNLNYKNVEGIWGERLKDPSYK